MSPAPLATPPAADSGPAQVQVGAKSMNFPKPPTFTDKAAARAHGLAELATAFRIFGKLGYDEGVAGHLTLRDPILPDHFWVNPLGLAFSLVCVSDLLLVSPEGNIVAGGKPDRQIYNQAAYQIHHAVHTARPNANAACHAHSIYAKAFSAFGRPIDCYMQDACQFYGDLAVYREFGGVVLSGDESVHIAEALGQCKAIILQNHGQLTVGETIGEAVFWFISLERLCQTQLLIEGAMGSGKGEPIKIPHDVAEFTKAVTGTPTSGWNSSRMYFDQIHAETKGTHLL